MVLEGPLHFSESCVQCSPCPGQPKVAYLQVTGGSDKKVAWLQVPVQHVRRVHVLQPFQNLHSVYRRLIEQQTQAGACRTPGQVSQLYTITFSQSLPGTRRTGSGRPLAAALT